jgi:pimeloyl-ACP methyl ester carboxylesterase
MKLQAEDMTISYEVYGNSAHPAVFLIHGLGGERGMWKHQIKPLLDAGYFVVAPDMLGHGGSSKVDHLSLDDFVMEIDLLADHLEITSFAIVGVSMGGVIAQHYAVHRHHRLSALVIADTFGDLQSFTEKLMGISQTLGFRILKLFGSGTFAKALTSAYKQTFAKEAREYLYEQALRADIGQLILARKAINRVEVLSALRGLSVPALVMVGDQFGGQFVEMNRKIASHLKNAEFRIIEESMDPSCLVQPERFNENLIDFLGRECAIGQGG